MFLQLDFHRDEEVHRVQPEQDAICAPNENVLLLIQPILDLSSDCAPDLLSLQFWNFRNHFQGLLIENTNFSVLAIDQHKPLPAFWQTQLRQNQRHVLRHFIAKAHLNLLPNFVSFVSHDQFCNLLVAHVRRSVNLNAKSLYVVQLILV